MCVCAERERVDDFVLVDGARCLHVLNLVRGYHAAGAQ